MNNFFVWCHSKSSIKSYSKMVKLSREEYKIGTRKHFEMGVKIFVN